ncbi:hypothetical protein Tco_1395064 [Tanacetum coccineum]
MKATSCNTQPEIICQANFTIVAQGDLETRLGHLHQLEDDVGKLWSEYYMLELARNDVEESLWPRVIMVQKKEMWPTLRPRINKELLVSYFQRKEFDHRGEHMMKVVSSGWSFVSAILGQMTYSIASPTLESAGSYVMQGLFFTQGTIPSIPIGGSISPEGFLLLVLLLVVIIVMVVVIVILIVVVDDDVSLILKLSFEIIGFLHRIMPYYLIH